VTSVSRSENASSDETGDPHILIAGPLSVDLRRYEVRLRGEEVRLTARELDLLVYLIRRAGSVASAEEISVAVWHGPTSTNTRCCRAVPGISVAHHRIPPRTRLGRAQSPVPAI